LHDIENLSLLNLGILCVHFYFNIYLRLSQGWRTLLDRRQTFKYVKLFLQRVLNDLQKSRLSLPTLAHLSSVSSTGDTQED
jgi:hypothetical protein